MSLLGSGQITHTRVEGDATPCSSRRIVLQCYRIFSPVSSLASLSALHGRTCSLREIPFPGTERFYSRRFVQEHMQVLSLAARTDESRPYRDRIADGFVSFTRYRVPALLCGPRYPTPQSHWNVPFTDFSVGRRRTGDWDLEHRKRADFYLCIPIYTFEMVGTEKSASVFLP